MPILAWRLATFLLAAISAGLALAPLLLPGWGGALPEGPAAMGAAAVAASAALLLAGLTRGRGAVAFGCGLLAALLLAASCATPWLPIAPTAGAVLRLAGLAALVLAALTERRHDPLANSAYMAARRLGVPQRQPRRG
jgi:hypothetical protein